MKMNAESSAGCPVRRILVGNRDLMNHYSVDVPAVQIDREHGHQLVYLAAGNEVGGCICACLSRKQ